MGSWRSEIEKTEFIKFRRQTAIQAVKDGMSPREAAKKYKLRVSDLKPYSRQNVRRVSQRTNLAGTVVNEPLQRVYKLKVFRVPDDVPRISHEGVCMGCGCGANERPIYGVRTNQGILNYCVLCLSKIPARSEIQQNRVRKKNKRRAWVQIVSGGGVNGTGKNR